LFDLVRALVRRAPVSANPWNAGTVEWLPEIPNPPWGARSIPVISSRYPLWDQPGLADDVQAGRFYLPDAPEGRRETLVTSTLDAMPQQCLRVPGPSFLAFWSAAFTGGVFIFPVYEQYVAAAASGFLAIVAILTWLWTGTALQPERDVKQVGRGLALPLYASGAKSVGWWAMCITMIGDMTAFASLVFGYFFFWTIHADFPPPQAVGPGLAWPLLGLLLAAASWGCTLLARRWNAGGGTVAFHGAAALALVLALGACTSLLAGPLMAGMDPTEHAYDAIVWLLLGWTALHVAVGALMQGYCIAR